LLGGSKGTSVEFNEAALDKASFLAAELPDIALVGASAPEADFSGARMDGAFASTLKAPAPSS